ncbi:hypothetical protein [Halalkalicoccus tibetensis]|uniref:HTH domain-containing protein n=1 Tax=Halalkalicoccus tibetensis TaxID=175632 RepID=A0ABD5V6C0_9EURY
MKLEEHERRRRIRELLIYEDTTPFRIVETIAGEFDVSDETVENDFKTVDDWIPKLDLLREVQGMSLLARFDEIVNGFIKWPMMHMIKMSLSRSEIFELRSIGPSTSSGS